MSLRDADAGPYLTDGAYPVIPRYENRPASFFARLQRMNPLELIGAMVVAFWVGAAIWFAWDRAQTKQKP
jgi:hypothetical protein